MIAIVGQFNDDFIVARPLVSEVMDEGALFMENAWAVAWADMLHCWCGCPL